MQKIVKCMRFKSILKPNYFKKQRFSIIVFTIIPKVNIDPKWSFSTKQANFIYLRNRTSLLSTPWPFRTFIFTSGK